MSRAIPSSLPLGLQGVLQGELYLYLLPIAQEETGWSGRCGKSHPTGIRTPNPPAYSESLYRVRYLGPHCYCYTQVKSLLILFKYNCTRITHCYRVHQYETVKPISYAFHMMFIYNARCFGVDGFLPGQVGRAATLLPSPYTSWRLIL